MAKKLDMLGKLAEETQFFASKDSNVSVTKWNKLLFIADCVALNHPRIKRPILQGFKYIKMPFGPVLRDYDKHLAELKLKNYISTTIFVGNSLNKKTFIEPNRKKMLEGKLSNKEKEVLLLTIDVFASFTAPEISNFSHMLRPWRSAEMFEEINLNLSKNETELKRQFKVNNLYDMVADFAV